jgi:hypothetical protein
VCHFGTKPLLPAIVNQQSLPYLSRRFKLRWRCLQKLAGNCEGITGSQGGWGFEGANYQIYFRRHFMSKSNRLRRHH